MVLGLPHRGIVVLSGFLLASAVFASLLSSPGTASSGPFLYSTYHGGAVEDVVEAIAVDGQGSAYLTGWTSSTDLPTTPGAFDASANGGDDAFVAKLSPDGGQMLYSTYLGGSGLDHATGIAVDAAGNAYVTGYTTSADFPTTVGALSRSLGGGWSAFITKLGPSGGALEYCRTAQRDGQVRLLGLTSHQRPLAAHVARSGLIDLLMIRYNAAHRGAEQEVFPITDALGMPVVVYTCLRWGALLEPTPDDPPDFVVPRAPDWYRFALQHPSVAVALMAPDNRQELLEDLQALEAPSPLSAEHYERLAAHGQRVRRHAGSFP